MDKKHFFTRLLLVGLLSLPLKMVLAKSMSIHDNPYGYSAAYLDEESSLQYLNARYYNVAILRFISRDSLDLANRYAYVDGNPIMNEDPSGHTKKNFLARAENSLQSVTKKAKVEESLLAEESLEEQAITATFNTLLQKLNTQAAARQAANIREQEIRQLIETDLDKIADDEVARITSPAREKRYQDLTLYFNKDAQIQWQIAGKDKILAENEDISFRENTLHLIYLGPEKPLQGLNDYQGILHYEDQFYVSRFTLDANPKEKQSVFDQAETIREDLRKRLKLQGFKKRIQMAYAIPQFPD